MPEHIAGIVPIAVLTMVRCGEIVGLRDRDVDFDAGSISVVSQQQDGARARTKTRAGRRTVDVGPATLKLLREQQLVRAPNSEGFLFPTRFGTARDAHNFYARVFKPAAVHAGMPELTFHDLRHTGASLMIAAGCHLKVIAEQMGHSDGGALVLKRYGHLYKGARKQAALALEEHVLHASRASAGSSGGGWQERPRIHGRSGRPSRGAQRRAPGPHRRRPPRARSPPGERHANGPLAPPELSGRRNDEEWFYLRGAGPSRWLKVVVHFEGGRGRIVTAFGRRSMP